jgi:RpiR family carbohydrate utilization transcriptional regulator
VRELAERAHVSKPTVVRFCRSMGYDGLADFKLKLAGSVSEGVPFIHRSVDADDKTGDVLVKVVDNAVAAFLQYRNAASTVAIERAARPLPTPGRWASASSSTARATPASWPRTRSTSSSAWA